MRLAATAPRVGLFGLLGSGNSGNDASMETVLAYLRDAHPDAVVNVMGGGDPARMRIEYGLDATPLYWSQKFDQRKSGAPGILLKALDKCIDAIRTMSWVSRHDVVIVPGAGALEATLPMRSWGFPFTLFLLCSAARLSRTKVALVSVGADIINQRAIRWLSDATARLAYYRSYRDSDSLEAMRQRGIDTSRDHVFPDLVFGVPTPPYDPGDPEIVGVGVMAYYGGNDDRGRADEIHAAYIEKMKAFTRWLVDSGHRVRLFGGDSKFDWDVADQILADVQDYRSDLDPSWVTADRVASYAELMQLMSPLGMVVATRYHNVMCALKLCKPTISLGYSRKFVALMGDMGLEEFNQYAHSFDVERLIEQFTEMEKRRTELQQHLADRNAANQRALEDQFTLLSEVLFGRARTPSGSV
jgi:polysaccharide pyruvyl transferase WcaK-like protein